jgi:hypothetical protein
MLRRCGSGLALGLAMSSPVGCDDDGPARERVCAPGQADACYGPGRCPGSQVCLDDGSGFAACDCGLGADAGASDMPAICSAGEQRVCTGADGCGGTQVCASNGAFGPCDCSGQGLAVGVLGNGCRTDADCGLDLECWASSAAGRAAFSGGAPRGYCTLPCQQRSDCTRLDPSAACSNPGPDGAGTCLRGCLSKDPLPNEAKCLDRVDQLCLSAAALGLEPFSTTERQPGVCVPQCGSDDDCDGRLCDPVQGTCVDERPPGLPIGAACTLETDCAGAICSAFPSGTRFCTAACSLDGLGCGYGDAADPREAACIAPWFNQDGVTEGRQDLGLCAELCYSTADCTQPGWSCDTSRGGPPGSNGVCVPDLDLFGSAGPPDAGSDAAAP